MAEPLTFNTMMPFLMDLRSRLEAGEEPTEEDKRKFQECVDILAPMVKLMTEWISEFFALVTDWWQEVWEAFTPELKEALTEAARRSERAQDRPEDSSRPLPLLTKDVPLMGGGGFTSVVIHEHPFWPNVGGPLSLREQQEARRRQSPMRYEK